MKTILPIVLFLVLAFVSIEFKAQVKSDSYNLMLKKLLSHSVQEVSVGSLSEMKGQVKLLDARELAEFEVSHISGAKHIGYDNFDTSAVSGLSKESPIIVYCSIGYRSEKIAEKLLTMGFQNVSNLYGGIFEWVNQGNAVMTKGEQTDRVHAYSRAWGIWLNKGEKVYE